MSYATVIAAGQFASELLDELVELDELHRKSRSHGT